MTFKEKLKLSRLSLNLSQADLSKITGISQRSLYSYEQKGIMPRGGNIRKLAEALDVSISYLLNDDITDPKIDMMHDDFIMDVKKQYGYKGMREANDILSRTSVLFAGGELDEEDKELFFQSIMEVYLKSKQQAREKFSNKKGAVK